MMQKIDASKQIEISERTKKLIRIVKSENIPIANLILFIIENWYEGICKKCKHNKSCEYDHEIQDDDAGNACFTSNE